MDVSISLEPAFMKQTKLLLATIAMLWCSLTASAHDFAVGGIYYNITSETDLTVEVTYRGNSYNSYSNEYSGAVTIPAAVTYNGRTYRVTSIGTSAFWECSSLTAITIPEGVTSIGNEAFCGCSSLTAITIPEGVTSIEGYAFYGCTSLTAINIPESVTSIGRVAFYGCTSLTAITIPENSKLARIEKSAFEGCSRLTSITIPEGVTSIGNWAFHDCSSLTSIIIPENSKLARIEKSAFYNCSSLTSITLSEGVTSIGDWAFYGCTSLYKVINCSNLGISKGSTAYGCVAYYAKKVLNGSNSSTVGDYQFYTSNGVHYLANYSGNDLNLVLPDSYNGENYKIADYAFYECSSLTAITIPEGVTSIGNYAFCGCSSLTAITIPEGVTSIEESAFDGCSSLTAITIPASVTSIGNKTFEGCTSLKELVIEDGNETLSLGYNYYYSGGTGEGLFYDCPLETIYWGRNLSYSSGESCGYSPFYDQKVLTSVTIGESVTSIEEWAFRDCNSLTSIIVEGGNTTYDSRDNCNAIIETSGNCLIVGCSTTIIPEGVTSIGMYAFYNCSNLTSITIPEGVTSIEDYAFYGCSRLTSITIPEGVTSIGNSAFYNCTSLTSITIPENSKLASIGRFVFYGCSNLTSITIPEGVTSIGNYAFNECTSLKELVIADGNETLSLGYNEDRYTYTGKGLFYDCPLETIYLGRNLSYDSSKQYGYSPFYNKKALTSVTIGESVTSIEDYAFNNCSNLTSITIPESVTSIGLYAFSGTAWYDNQPDGVIYINKVLYTYKGTMPANTSIEVKEGTEYIANRAFYDCSNLTSITIPEGVTSIEESAFYNCTSLTSITIPENSKLASIGRFVFYGCSNLTSITIPEGVTSIGYEAFRGCSSLTSINIPEGVTRIVSEAFYGCSSLTSITIPESVTSIGEYAFYYCSNLTSITIPENSELRSIEKSAFSGCSRLTAIIIPEYVTSIENYAFNGCTSLKELVIADGSKTLSLGYNKYDDRYTGKGLFYDCPLETIYLGRNLSYYNDNQLGYSPFYNQEALTSVTIGESVTSIGESAFRDCSSLTAVHIKDIASWCNISFGDSDSNPLYYAKNLYLNGELVTELTIPNTVTAIKDYVFSGCRNLSSITIPESVTSIGKSAFNGCTSLKELVIADGSETLSLGYNMYDYFGTGTGKGLFYDCPLETIYLGRNLSYDSRQKYGYSPFYNKKALTSVTIGERVTSIGEIAFYNCSSLTAVHIKDIASWCNINFSDYIANPLYYAKNLYLNGELVTELTIPNTVTAIKRYAFFGCSSLTSITIPENVTSIGNYAFYNCSSLTSITLSEGVTSIGDDSFSGCSNVENLVVKGSAMPHVPSDKLKKIVLYSPAPLQSKGFSATVYQNCMLYVPQQGLARYQIVEPWAYFWNIIAFDTSDIAPAELPEDDSAPIIYDLRGQRVDVPTRGNIYIVNGRKVLY